MYKRTKIVCTMGPACDNDDVLREMMKAGMNVARFNFSHGSYEEHHERIERVRRIADELDMTIGILLDTKGPEVRTGLLKDHQKIAVKTGDKIVVTAQPTSEDWLGDSGHISLDYVNLPAEVEEGSRILIDDGIVELVVERVDGQDMHCVVKNDGEIGERKGVNLPNVEIGLPAITERDREDILFGLSEGIDYIAASFIRSGSAVREIRELCNANGGEHVGVFSKIESAQGVKNFDEILKASTGIMIARGDLGIEIAPELVPHLQKEMIKKCNAAYKPVITATQMLDSMIRNPRPTRAEVTDVANAIDDGTDATMLSGETAAGKYPLEAVKMMASIALTTEATIPAHKPFDFSAVEPGRNIVNAAVGLAAVTTAFNVGAKAILTPTNSGKSARLVSNFRPMLPIQATTPNEWAQRKMTVYWGVEPRLNGRTVGSLAYVVDNAMAEARETGAAHKGDLVVITAGDPAFKIDMKHSEVSTNVVYVAQVI